MLNPRLLYVYSLQRIRMNFVVSKLQVGDLLRSNNNFYPNK